MVFSKLVEEPLNKHARGEGGKKKKKVIFLNRGIEFVQSSPEAKK